ncbi:MAG TPA: hypothetical protein VGM23_16745, partial [Armatimonadota bacterium]
MKTRLLALVVIVCAALQPAFATLFTADQISELSVRNMGLKTPLPLVEEGGTKAVVTDLSKPHDGNWYRGIPIGTVGWQKVPPGRYIVRLRAAVDSVGAANVSLWCEVKGAMPDNSHALLGWHHWLGTDFAKAGAFQDLDTIVDVKDATMILPSILWRRGTKEVGDIKQIK